MKTSYYIIIEDELLEARMLEEAIGQLRPGYRMLHHFSTIRESVEYFQTRPDSDILIFMDIELADGQCFEIFNKCHVANPIVFTTSHDEWAIQAFRVNSIDYLLKPIEDEDLKRAIEKHENQISIAEANITKYISLLSSVRDSRTHQDRLLINCGNRYIAVETYEMAFFEAGDNYVALHTISGQEYIVDYTLKDLSSLLPPQKFYRYSRSCIISRDIIRDVRKTDQGRLSIRFKAPYQSREGIVSSLQKDNFLQWYGK